jgi:hypothetical protein
MVPVPLAYAVAQALKAAPRKSSKAFEAADVTPLAKLAAFDAQARESQREGTVAAGQFFYMSQPARSELSELLQTVPAIVQKKLAGVRHQIHKSAEGISVISDDGADNTDRFPQLVQAVENLEPEQLVLAASVERWNGAQQLPREAVDAYISSTDAADDGAAGIVGNVYDLLHDGEDIHKCLIGERLSRLAGIGLPQATERRPDLAHRLNRVPHHHAETAEQLERITRALGGAVIKRADSSEELVLDSAAVPTSQVRKAKTTAALLVEAGPPNEWSGGVAAVLGKEMRTKITRLWRALSPEDRKRVQSAFQARHHAWMSCSDVTVHVQDRYGPIAKQRDPYLDVPPETGTYRFVAQMHFRGKSVHGDLRFQTGGKDLIGWTLDVQIAGAQKTEVTTLPEARSAVSGDKMGQLSKINFRSGDWVERPRRGADKPARTLVRSHRKNPHPAAWLNVEGVTERPDPGEPPAAGATQNFPGVFLAVDNGTVEYGAQKATSHEYFLQGKALNYRVIFRLLRLEKRVLKKLEPCMCTVCKQEPAVFDGLPADCSAPAVAVCDGCVDSWATRQKGTVVSKQQLPPSKPSEKEPSAEETWFAIRPDDPRPNVLQSAAVAEGWMPPLGISALPKAVRLQVPEKLRYWGAQTATKARDLRDQLVDALKDGTVEIDFAAPYKTTTKSAPRFVLQQQFWHSSTTPQIWLVRVDTGKGQALEVALQNSPLDNAEVSAAVSKASLATLDARGDVPLGTALNKSATASYIERIDGGGAVITVRTDDRIVLELSGSELDGVFELQRGDGSNWTWHRGKDTRNFVPVIKVNEKEGIVTGVVMEPDEVDGEN